MPDKKTPITLPAPTGIGCTDWLAAVERAYRDGYRDGYCQGENDQSDYDWGHSKHSETKKREAEEAWESSATKAANAPGEPPARENQKL